MRLHHLSNIYLIVLSFLKAFSFIIKTYYNFEKV